MLTTDIPKIIGQELSISSQQVVKTMELLDEGNTVPFIARYRKEVTGSLTDEQVRLVSERAAYLRNFVKRQEEILSKIEEQGKLTASLRDRITKAVKLQELEDLYLPYRQKRATRASKARERGLAGLAKAIREQKEKRGDCPFLCDFLCQSGERCQYTGRGAFRCPGYSGGGNHGRCVSSSGHTEPPVEKRHD